MRVHAYQLQKEAYEELESQILQQLREGDHDQLRHLVGDHELDVELLSGEWRLLFEAVEEDFYQVNDVGRRIARMAVSPAELSALVNFLRDPQRKESLLPVAFGLAELTDALPADCDLVGVVFVEETDDWLWAPPANEIVAIRPEVYTLIEPHLRALLGAEDWAAAARLASDHSEGSVEFSSEQWRVLMRHAGERVPELLSVFDGRLSTPADYTSIIEALAQVADPRFQPSLDAWIRVHSQVAQYSLYFRDAALERQEFDGSGLIRINSPGPATTQPLPNILPAPGERHAAGMPPGADPGETLPGVTHQGNDND